MGKVTNVLYFDFLKLTNQNLFSCPAYETVFIDNSKFQARPFKFTFHPNTTNPFDSLHPMSFPPLNYYPSPCSTRFFFLFLLFIAINFILYVKQEREREREYIYAGTEKGDAVAMILAFGNVGHLLHGSTIRQDVPLAPQPFIT